MCSKQSVRLALSVLVCFGFVACSSDATSGVAISGDSVAGTVGGAQSGAGGTSTIRAGTGGVPGVRTGSAGTAAAGGTTTSAAAGSGASAAAGGAPASSAAGTGPSAGAAGSTAGAAAAGQASADIFVAATGADTNPGSEAMPLASLAAAVEKASPGKTIWVAAGTYVFTDTIALEAKGTEEQPIRIWARSADERPVFDFKAQTRGDSKARGIEISGDYWHLRGLDVINAGDNCIHIAGAHNTLEWLVTHDCSDTGIQISANSSEAGDKTRAANNLILNCDSYANYDAQNQGENADGFAAKLYIGPGNVFRGCRAWNNADDGWDLFASDDVVVIEDCWAIANGKIGATQSNSNGDGNGFKLGGAAKAGDANMGGAPHEVNRCFSIGNRACGFVRNNNTQSPRLSSCGGQGDGKGLLCSLDNSGNASVSMSASDAIMAKRDKDGKLPPVH